MNIDDAFPSDYVKAGDLKGQEVKLTMANVEMVTFQDEDGTKKDAPVLHFLGQKKALRLNVTNKNAIKEAYGSNTNNWYGHPIYLFSVKTDLRGKVVDGVRVRAPTAQEMLAAVNPMQQSAEPKRYPDDRITSGPQRAVPRMPSNFSREHPMRGPQHDPSTLADTSQLEPSDFPGDEPPPWDQA